MLNFDYKRVVLGSLETNNMVNKIPLKWTKTKNVHQFCNSIYKEIISNLAWISNIYIPCFLYP